MADDRPVVGIDLGGTNVQIGVVDRTRQVIGRAKRKTRAEDGADAVLDRLVEGIGEACEKANVATGDLAAVGIGAPGPIDPLRGVVIEAVNLRWRNMPLAETFASRLGPPTIPVVVDNDVNVAVYGENVLGAGQNARDLLGVWIGTGIGGGLILGGQLYYGAFHTAGEIGHMTLFPGNPPGGRILEHNASRTAIVDRIVRLIRANRESVIPSLVDGRLDRVKSKTVARAYEMGDELTVEVVDNAAELLGVSIAGVVTLLSLGRVVLGGGLTEALGESLVSRVADSVRRHVFPETCRDVTIVATTLKDDAGLLGAAMLALERLGS